MRYEELLGFVAEEGWFDLATLVQLSGEPRHSIRVQLSRWCRAGKLLPLRRGMYMVPKPYCGVELNPAAMANRLYDPSYLSGHWALAYYGMIPEYTPVFTSVTTRKPSAFENALGTFRYRHIKQSAFFGYRAVEMGGSRVLLAEPEKALLDLWHLHAGEWTWARMEAMRFQQYDAVRIEKLMQYAERFRSPRLVAAAETWCKLSADEGEWATL